MQVDKPKLAEGYYDKIYSALVEMETLPDTKVEVGEDSDLEERIEVANSFILGLEKQLAVARQTTSNNDKVLAQLEDVDTQLKDYEVLRCLQEAYGNKGIKNSTLLDICSRLESNLNYWSWSVFPEPIHFAIEVSHSKIDILAYRNPCTDFERVSDVRHLSGGESRAFNLLLLLSLLPLIPSSRRLNIVVLDECTANMDNQTKRLVFEQYIPLLTDIVPHVIVLDTGTTPIDGAQELYAVKEMGITNLLETI
jgi:DNA repair exonuclease SbcCD ATPase subunit